MIRYEKFNLNNYEIYYTLYIVHPVVLIYMCLPLKTQWEYMENMNTKMVGTENDNHDCEEIEIKENMDNNRQNGEVISTENNEERDVC